METNPNLSFRKKLKILNELAKMAVEWDAYDEGAIILIEHEECEDVLKLIYPTNYNAHIAEGIDTDEKNLYDLSFIWVDLCRDHNKNIWFSSSKLEFYVNHLPEWLANKLLGFRCGYHGRKLLREWKRIFKSNKVKCG